MPKATSNPAMTMKTNDPQSRLRLSVFCDGGDERRAADLAADLHLPLNQPADLQLTVTATGLELRGEGKPLRADHARINVTSSQGRTLKQPIARAVGLRKKSDLPITLIDAAAGFGEDSYLLASLGCTVTAIERNPVVAALLRDGQPDLHVITADARDALRGMTADVVYLDPMFPTGRKTAERKAMKVLRHLVGDDGDANELLEVALQAATHRVVVKRALRAAPLADRAPSHTHKGKAARYDVYHRH